MLRRLIIDVAKHSACRAGQPTVSSECLRGTPLLGRVAAAALETTAYSTDVKANLFNATPKSLASDRLIAEPQPGIEQNFLTRALLKIGGYYTRESRLLRGAKAWYQCVVEQSDDSRLYEAFSLEDNFANRYSLLSIHMWLCLVRLRSEGQDGKDLAQIVYENFTEDVEIRVRAAGVKVRISKHLTDLEQMFYGTSLSYDQAIEGKEDLSSAVLRNVYGKNTERRKAADLLARYIMRELACLSVTESQAVMKGSVTFSTDFLRS